MKFATIIDSLPLYTQVSTLYTVLGALNASAINSASREVAADLKQLEAANRAAGKDSKTNVISIDKYNELMNEMRQHSVNEAMSVEQGFEDKADQPRFLDIILTLRSPLLAMFNAAQAKLPNRGGEPASFTFEESLARQLAREYSVEQRAQESIDEELVKSGVVTAEELAEADKKRFDDDQAFKQEFKFLILDKLNDNEPLHVDLEDADAAFDALGEDYQHRLLHRVLPKLLEAKTQQIGRRSFDPDAPTNILLLGLAINEIKKFLGESDAEAKLAKLQAALAA